MRTLHTTEIDIVSGAGKLADNGLILGNAVGGVLDALSTVLGVSSTSTYGEAFGLVGSAVGSFAEVDIETGIKNLVAGITKLISALTPAAPAATA